MPTSLLAHAQLSSCLCQGAQERPGPLLELACCCVKHASWMIKEGQGRSGAGRAPVLAGDALRQLHRAQVWGGVHLAPHAHLGDVWQEGLERGCILYTQQASAKLWQLQQCESLAWSVTQEGGKQSFAQQVGSAEQCSAWQLHNCKTLHLVNSLQWQLTWVVISCSDRPCEDAGARRGAVLPDKLCEEAVAGEHRCAADQSERCQRPYLGGHVLLREALGGRRRRLRNAATPAEGHEGRRLRGTLRALRAGPLPAHGEAVFRGFCSWPSQP